VRETDSAHDEPSLSVLLRLTRNVQGSSENALRRKLERVVYPAGATSHQSSPSSPAQRRKSSRMRASMNKRPPIQFSELSEKIQRIMCELGMDGWTAQDALAHLQQILNKSANHEQASRRKFRRARRKHVRPPTGAITGAWEPCMYAVQHLGRPALAATTA
jgi:hypothetical protein